MLHPPIKSHDFTTHHLNISYLISARTRNCDLRTSDSPPMNMIILSRLCIFVTVSIFQTTGSACFRVSLGAIMNYMVQSWARIGVWWFINIQQSSHMHNECGVFAACMKALTLICSWIMHVLSTEIRPPPKPCTLGPISKSLGSLDSTNGKENLEGLEIIPSNCLLTGCWLYCYVLWGFSIFKVKDPFKSCNDKYQTFAAWCFRNSNVGFMDHSKMNTLVFLGCLSDKARKFKTLVTCDGMCYYLWLND